MIHLYDQQNINYSFYGLIEKFYVDYRKKILNIKVLSEVKQDNDHPINI